MGVEPNALVVSAGKPVDTAIGCGIAAVRSRDWRFGDTHWRHLVTTRQYDWVSNAGPYS
jgi:hypothetical protein